MPKHSYGWVPDLPDQRDFMFAAPVENMAALPPNVDLRPQCPKEVYDQGQLGSCTANAIAGALEFDQIKQTDPNIFMPSRLFIYYNERAMEGTTGTDSGAQIRDGVKSVATLGVCPETEWPYDGTQANSDGTFPAQDPAGEKPTDTCYKDALGNRATTYSRVIQNLDQMRGCLAAGYPFVFGFTVYSSF